MSNPTIELSPAMTVNEVIRQVPASIAIFKRVGIDSCCGGSSPVGEAAKRHGVELEALLREIRNS